jgi:hypothetical protein
VDTRPYLRKNGKTLPSFYFFIDFFQERCHKKTIGDLIQHLIQDTPISVAILLGLWKNPKHTSK